MINFLLFIQVDLSKLRYFYIDEIDAYFINKVDRDQKLAHRQVNNFFFHSKKSSSLYLIGRRIF